MAQLTNNHALTQYIPENTDRELITVLMADLADAVEHDVNEQARKGLRKKEFKMAEWNRLISEAYPMSNNNAFKRGKIIGSKIKDGKPLNAGDGKIKAQDLEKVCLYILGNQGVFEWPSVRKAIEKAGPTFKPLLKITPITLNDRVKTVKSKVADYPDPGQIVNLLRSAANDIEMMGYRMGKVLEENHSTRESLVLMAKEKTQRNAKFKLALEKLEEASKLISTINSEEDKRKFERIYSTIIKDLKQIV